MGIFDGIKTAQVRHNSVYLLPGQYIVRLDRFAIIPKTQTKSGLDTAVVEYTVLVVLQNQASVGKESNKVGSLVGSFYKSGKMFLSNIKTMIAAVMQIDDSVIDEPHCDKVFGELQPLVGTVMELHAYDKPLKENPGKVFTHADWKAPVSYTEAAKRLEPKDVERFFPNGQLAAEVQLEAEEAAAAEAAQVAKAG